MQKKKVEGSVVKTDGDARAHNVPQALTRAERMR